MSNKKINIMNQILNKISKSRINRDKRIKVNKKEPFDLFCQKYNYFILLSTSIAYLSISLVISSTSSVKILAEISTMILFLLKTILT